MANAADSSDGHLTRQRLTPQARRLQLLVAAERTFAKLGYQGAAMENIAGEAGVTRGLVYNYFPDKDALYLECVRRAREELTSKFVLAALGEGELEAQYAAGMRAYFRFVQERAEGWDILFGGGIAVTGAVGSEVARLQTATVREVGALIKRLLPHLSLEEATVFSYTGSGAAERLTLWWRAHPEVPLERVVGYLMASVWKGLGSA